MGFFDPASPLRVRILHVGKPVTLDESWWRTRLGETLERRRGVADEGTDGLRLINGESDGWPGLVVDRYDGVLVMKLYTPAWLPRLTMLRDLLAAATGPERIVLRLSRNLQAKAAESGFRDGQILHGPALEGVVTFLESGLRFEADVLRGQKTGFFLDQRENRRRVATLSRGAEVLNAFSFTGGFSLYAARGGAKSVTDTRHQRSRLRKRQDETLPSTRKIPGSPRASISRYRRMPSPGSKMPVIPATMSSWSILLHSRSARASVRGRSRPTAGSMRMRSDCCAAEVCSWRPRVPATSARRNFSVRCGQRRGRRDGVSGSWARLFMRRIITPLFLRRIT